MVRVAATLLVLVGTLGVATGGLLKPCDCPRGHSSSGASTGSCCHGGMPMCPGRKPSRRPFEVCCRGPAPVDVPVSGPQLPAPALSALPARPARRELARVPGMTSERSPRAHGPPWLLSTEGLSRLVI